MATDVGAIRASLTLETGKFQTGVRQARQDLKQLGDGAKSITSNFGQLERALTAVGASTALIGLARAVQSLAKEAQTAAMGVQGLIEVSKALGVSVDKSTGLAKKFADEGLMSIADASNAVKTALSMNLSLEQTESLMRNLADSAAYNRAAHLSMSEAIVQGVQAIKMGNSELLDNTGVVENLSVMQDRYAKSIGTTADKLTEHQKVLAALSGVQQASALFAGNAAKSMEGYAGTQATWTSTIATARAEIGEAFLPVLQELMRTLTPLVVDFVKWAEVNKETVAGVTAGTMAVTGLVAIAGTLTVAIGALSAAMTALNISIGPLGWLLAAGGVLSVGLIAYDAATNAAAASTKRLAEQTSKLAQEYDYLNGRAKALGEGTGEAIAAKARMAEILEEIKRVAPDVAKAYEAEEVSVRSLTEAYKANTRAKIDNLKAEVAKKKAEIEELKAQAKKAEPYNGGILGGSVRANTMIKDYRVEQMEREIADLETALATKFNEETYVPPRAAYVPTPTTPSVTAKPAAVKSSTSSYTPKEKSVEEIAAELRRDAYSAEMARIRFEAEMYDWSADQQIEAYERVQDKHKRYLSENIEDERTIALYIKRLTEDGVKARLDIERDAAEQRRRLREREQADIESQLRDINRETTEHIRNLQRKEIESLDARKQATSDYYDSQIRALDDAERAQDKADVIAQIEKYRFATSREGQEKLAELEKQLAKMTTDEKRRALQDEKSAKLRSLDEERRAVETYYDEVLAAFQSTAFTIENIEKLTQNGRLSSLKSTNKDMLAELQTFVAEWNRINAQRQYTTGNLSTGGPSTLDVMRNNSDAWHGANGAERERLAAENQKLGASIGATYNAGTWYKDGKPLYHTGGVVGVGNFRSADRLMPDEIAALVKRNEIVMTPQQAAQLVGSGRGGVGTNITVQGPLISHEGDVRLEDDADIRTYWSERDLAAQRLLSEGLR